MGLGLYVYTVMAKTERGTAHSGGGDRNNYAKFAAARVIFTWWLELSSRRYT